MLTLKKGQGQDRETEACLCQFHLYPLLSSQALALRQTRASQRKLGFDYDEHQPSTLSFHPETFEASLPSAPGRKFTAPGGNVCFLNSGRGGDRTVMRRLRATVDP